MNDIVQHWCLCTFVHDNYKLLYFTSTVSFTFECDNPVQTGVSTELQLTKIKAGTLRLFLTSSRVSVGEFS